MNKIQFNRNDRPTLGIELELGLVDEQTMQLSSSIDKILAHVPEADWQYFKPELMQCCLEITTGICRTVGEAEADLRQKLAMVERITDREGLRLWWGATHPF